MPPVVVLDANILVPIIACDFLLTAFDRHLIEPIVSEFVLDEVERTLIEDFPRLDPTALRRRVGHMRIALTDQTIDTAAREMVPATINSKDRHVVAAALMAEATVVVTNDVTLRAEIAAGGLDHLEPVDADAFALRLWRGSPAEVSGVIDAMVAKRRKLLSAAAMVEQLRQHFPSMATAWSAAAE